VTNDGDNPVMESGLPTLRPRQPSLRPLPSSSALPQCFRGGRSLPEPEEANWNGN
jgi:hypothetical protein